MHCRNTSSSSCSGGKQGSACTRTALSLWFALSDSVCKRRVALFACPAQGFPANENVPLVGRDYGAYAVVSADPAPSPAVCSLMVWWRPGQARTGAKAAPQVLCVVLSVCCAICSSAPLPLRAIFRTASRLTCWNDCPGGCGAKERRYVRYVASCNRSGSGLLQPLLREFQVVVNPSAIEGSQGSRLSPVVGPGCRSACSPEACHDADSGVSGDRAEAADLSLAGQPTPESIHVSQHRPSNSHPTVPRQRHPSHRRVKKAIETQCECGGCPHRWWLMCWQWLGELD